MQKVAQRCIKWPKDAAPIIRQGRDQDFFTQTGPSGLKLRFRRSHDRTQFKMPVAADLNKFYYEHLFIV